MVSMSCSVASKSDISTAGMPRSSVRILLENKSMSLVSASLGMPHSHVALSLVTFPGFRVQALIPGTLHVGDLTRRDSITSASCYSSMPGPGLSAETLLAILSYSLKIVGVTVLFPSLKHALQWVRIAGPSQMISKLASIPLWLIPVKPDFQTIHSGSVPCLLYKFHDSSHICFHRLAHEWSSNRYINPTNSFNCHIPKKVL